MIGWIDGGAGASGDMLLGALVDVGVELSGIQEWVDQLGLGIILTAAPVTRASLGATKVDVETSEAPVHRTWADVRLLLERVDEPVRTTALEVFARLAEAEGRVHRVSADEVHFHEVGALDALGDVVGVCAGFHLLGLERLTAGTLSLGSGQTRGAHGPLPVPAPAVLELLHEIPCQAGPSPREATTPTGAALLAVLVDGWEPMPAMTPSRTGHGAGSRDLDEVANLLRLVVGTTSTAGTAEVLEANVDDMDPRLWPGVLQALLDAGASDAWLTPILMKKGRPAHTLSVLCTTAQAPALRAVVFRETTTIGLRQRSVDKHALDRTEELVHVEGHPVRVKSAWYEGVLVNRNPEWEDVARAAKALGRPVQDVLAQARL